jgi:hypothetical protein
VIGVITNSADSAVVREFFELFKTPWEVYESGRFYEVVLCTGDVDLQHIASALVVVYSDRKAPCDSVSLLRQRGGRMLSYGNACIPVYGECLSFPGKESGVLTDQESREPAAYIERSGPTVIAQIGYDLFAEVRFLLTEGQPVSNAGIPTLDLHIAVLRDLIIANGVHLIEIPPVPAGYRFIACLTHDVDHPSIRLHRFDHTCLGFLYRAIFGSVINMARRRATVRHVLTNWTAALKLPFVYLGWARDFWKEFEHYPALGSGLPSTFFVIPVQGNPGRHSNGCAPRERASRYGAADIRDSINTLKAAGCEIGLHGIDAWRDDVRARDEMQQLRRVTQSEKLGVRMHWLYFDQHSPAVLDNAGIDYDSTVGYNEAVGYRAGTAQAYKPLEAERLLELPLIIMDTALFFPRRQSLSAEQARVQIEAILDNAAEHGGCVTVNWHDRSISPERNWGAFYTEMIQGVKMRGVWFATATQVVAWFRKRRSAVFKDVSYESQGLRVRTVVRDEDPDLPALQLHVTSGESFQNVLLCTDDSDRVIDLIDYV